MLARHSLAVLLLAAAAAHADHSGRKHPENETLARTGVIVTVGVADADIVGRDNRALQAAVDYVGNLGGGVVEIGPGEYLMRDSLHLRNRVTIRGVGEKTILKKDREYRSRLAADGDYGEEAITVQDPEGFNVGRGVYIGSNGARYFNGACATLLNAKGNYFTLSRPLKPFYYYFLRQTEAAEAPDATDAYFAAWRPWANDVPLMRSRGGHGAGRLLTSVAHRRAVESLVTTLKPWRNWFLDLANEHNVRDDRFVGIEELGQLRETVKPLDPRRLTTASGGDLSRDDLRKQRLFDQLDEQERAFVKSIRELTSDPIAPARVDPSAKASVHATGAAPQIGRLRVLVETDAGGDPDDEQSLVRFLLYANEWDVEGIIANRPQARDGENLNPERTGVGIVRRFIRAYADCYPNLVKHDARYPRPEELLRRTVPGYADSNAGVNLVLSAVDSDDPRPVWFMNWGTDHGSAPSCLKRALDRVLAERGPAGYATFKNRLRLTGDDQFGDHTGKIEPPFRIWVDTLRPEVDRRRWYHRFSAITGTAGGFDLRRDVLTGHGPLGALYPTNTGPPQKEGDTMMFLYLVPTGMNDPEQPTWGSWAGRYGRNPDHKPRPYYWATEADTWQGTTHRENTLSRWAAHLQNDFRARLDWCVNDVDGSNHPPAPRIKGPLRCTVAPGAGVTLEADGSSDPDSDELQFAWMIYPEAGSYRGPLPELQGSTGTKASFRAPETDSAQTIHVILTVTDNGSPPLTRYARIIVTVDPERSAAGADACKPSETWADRNPLSEACSIPAGDGIPSCWSSTGLVCARAEPGSFSPSGGAENAGSHRTDY